MMAEDLSSMVKKQELGNAGSDIQVLATPLVQITAQPTQESKPVSQEGFKPDYRGIEQILRKIREEYSQPQQYD